MITKTLYIMMQMQSALGRLRRDQKAQAMTEYVVTVAAILGVIALASTDQLPFFPTLVRSFQAYLDGMHMVVTLPIP